MLAGRSGTKKLLGRRIGSPLLAVLALALAISDASQLAGRSHGNLRPTASVALLELSKDRQRHDTPPGDVSGIDDLADTIHKAGAGKAIEAASDVGGVISEDLSSAAVAAEEALKDPVGAIGGAVDTVAANLESQDEEGEEEQSAPPSDTQIPEAAENLAGYKAVTTTKRPAPFNGVYCRGTACQFRRVQGSSTSAAEALAATAFAQEPCRGILCDPPPDVAKVTFRRACVNLFNNIEEGEEEPSTIGDAKGIFSSVCQTVVPLEKDSCPDYSDVVVAALAPDVREPKIGDVDHVCDRLYDFAQSAEKMALTLGLTLPERPGKTNTSAAASLLQEEKDHRPSPWSSKEEPKVNTESGAGLCSASGRHWAKWWYQRHPANGHSVTGVRKSGMRGQAALVQSMAKLDSSCRSRTSASSPAMASASRYEVSCTPPLSVESAAFDHCLAQVEELTLNETRTAETMVEMTREWCAVQSIPDETGMPAHPEWEMTDCTVLGELMGFSLRKDLSSPEKLPFVDVCKSMFMGLFSIHQARTLASSGWNAGVRIPVVGKSPAQRVPKEEPRSTSSLNDVVAKEVATAARRAQAAQEAQQRLAKAKAAIAREA